MQAPPSLEAHWFLNDCADQEFQGRKDVCARAFIKMRRDAMQRERGEAIDLFLSELR